MESGCNISVLAITLFYLSVVPIYSYTSSPLSPSIFSRTSLYLLPFFLTPPYLFPLVYSPVCPSLHPVPFIFTFVSHTMRTPLPPPPTHTHHITCSSFLTLHLMSTFSYPHLIIFHPFPIFSSSYPTIGTLPSLPSLPTFPTLPTIPTYPPYHPYLPSLPSLPSLPTLPTIPYHHVDVTLPAIPMYFQCDTVIHNSYSYS